MQSVKLNLIPGAVLPVVNVSQYDVKRTFALAVYDGAASYDLTGKTVTIRGTKPDNHGFDYGTSDGVISVSGNTVTVSTTQQMTAVGGQVMAELRIESGTTIIGTLNFIIDVEPSALSDDTILSDTEIPVIERNFEAALAEAEADALVAEGYAKGTQEGTPVGAGSPYYQDNAKYYKEEAEAAASGVLEKYPKIVSDYWYIWDVDTNQYVNTGVRAKGTQGDPGQGVPAGGTTGQVLKKKSNSDYDCEWGTGGGGGASALDDLTDVDITSPASGQGLLFDGAEWVNGAVVVPDELTNELRDAEVIEGKNLFDVNSAVIRNSGVTSTVNADGSVTLNGTVASGQNFVFIDSPNLNCVAYNVQPNKIYVMSYGDSLISGLSIKAFYKTGGSWVSIGEASDNAYLTFTTPASFDDVWVQIYAPGGTVITNKTLYPMLCTKEEWDKSHNYEPYYVPVKDRKLDISTYAKTGAVNLFIPSLTAQVKDGITWTPDYGGKGIIKGNGTTSSDSYIDIGTVDLSEGTYYLSGCAHPQTNLDFRLRLSFISGGTESAIVWNDDANTETEFTVTAATAGTWTVRIRYSNNKLMNNALFYPMITPVKGAAFVAGVMTNKELTDELSVKTTKTTGYPSSATVTKNIVKKSGKMVTVDFAATGFSKSAYGGLFNIPAGYRPSENTSAFIINLSDNTFIPVSIGSDNGSVVTYLEISNKSVAFHVSYMQS